MNRPYIISAFVCIFLAIITYALTLGVHFKLPFSNSPADWGALGDYFGGVLNPILSFFSILLIIKSIDLQRESNIDFRNELEHSKRDSQLRSFESKLFALISTQAEQFKHFSLLLQDASGKKHEIFGKSAILEIRELLIDLLSRGISPNVPLLINHLDSNDAILSCIRRFYVPLRLIATDLSDKNGYTRQEREKQIQTLINFTELSLLQLIIFGISDATHETAKYIKDNVELTAVLKELEFNAWPIHP